ncbi:hypothetical protein FHU41_000902 [Psychromicrobium silvestre]|uniref:Uncharacterized protein n=1 Tax=Psychromicrobium silvestre TaxID=1645614 RepID=A0A7Y9LSB4_9MICC|nr:hypothetical protein [Psychromicrobium silvestre]NYE94681.1 hypothetical protein [Psychromicrobium silvestre]
MRFPRLFDLPRKDSTQALIKRWETLSAAQCWRTEGDWRTPELEIAAESMADEGQLSVELARKIGNSRGFSGVSIAESIADFRLLYQAAEQDVDLDCLQGFVEGWVVGWEPGPAISCTEPGTGLSTSAHFHRVLTDSMAVRNTAQHWALGALKFTQLPPASGLDSWFFEAKLGELAAQTLRDSGATVSYSQGTILVLLERSTTNFSSLLHLQESLLRSFGEELGATQLEYESLPKNISEARDLLEGFIR